jgi:hypothetical protein
MEHSLSEAEKDELEEMGAAVADLQVTFRAHNGGLPLKRK